MKDAEERPPKKLLCPALMCHWDEGNQSLLGFVFGGSMPAELSFGQLLVFSSSSQDKALTGRAAGCHRSVLCLAGLSPPCAAVVQAFCWSSL